MSQRKKKDEWSIAETEFLIDEVRGKAPFIYDKSHEKYHDKDARSNAFQFIGQQIGIPGAAVERRWSYLRDTFQRVLKKTKFKRQTGSAGEPSFYYWKRMLFLKDFKKETRSYGGNYSSTRYRASATADIIVGSAFVVNEEAPCNSSIEDDQYSGELAACSRSLFGSCSDHGIVKSEQLGSLTYVSPIPVTASSSDGNSTTNQSTIIATDNDIVNLPKTIISQSHSCGTCSSGRQITENEAFGIIISKTLDRLPEQKQSFIRMRIMSLIHEVHYGNS